MGNTENQREYQREWITAWMDYYVCTYIYSCVLSNKIYHEKRTKEKQVTTPG